MDLGLTDKAFLIGGASRGLGLAIAEQLVAEGARVLLVARDADALWPVVDRLGERAIASPADLANPAGVDLVAATVERTFGALDGILVNAGGPPGGTALELTEEQWLGAFQLLIAGPLRLLRALVPKMNEGGSILFITSSSVRQPIPNLDSSNVLRPGVAALAKTLARELGPRIRVNSLAPGRFDTDRVRTLDESRANLRNIPVEQVREEATQAIPLGRYGDPAEIGRVGAFLLSPAASYLSGISVQADGAMVTAVP